MDQFQQIVNIMFGWCLGLLAPAIVERIRRTYRRDELIAAIKNELMELQYRVAMLSYLLRSRRASMSNEFLAWIEPIIRTYTGPEKADNILNAVVNLRSVSEEDRAKVFRAVSGDPSRGFTLKEQSLPLLTVHLSDIATLPMSFQGAVLHVKTRVELFNQHVRYLQGQGEKTFSTTGENHDIVCSNLEAGYMELASMGEQIADAVSRVPSGKSRFSFLRRKGVKRST